MIIAKNDEEKRSKVWRFVIVATTIVIILIVGFFITKLFTGNPLEGTWRSEDNNLTLTISGKNSLTVKWDELFEETNVKVKLDYTLDKDAKTITVKVDESFLEKAVEKSEGDFTKDNLKISLSKLATTFDYSVEREMLILTEREYGEQLVFIRE